jgi:hypothetical protein
MRRTARRFAELLLLLLEDTGMTRLPLMNLLHISPKWNSPIVSKRHRISSALAALLRRKQNKLFQFSPPM